MNLLVVLSHLMSKACRLDTQSVARAQFAIDKFSGGGFDLLVTSGWAYRVDCSASIASVVKDYILKNSSIDENAIVSIDKSRDTVGDAIYCLDLFGKTNITALHVVTSDYHVDRVSKIFNAIFDNNVSIEVSGVNTEGHVDSNTAENELRSIQAFFRTFQGVDFSSKRAVLNALSKNHPYYNGEIYPKITDERS